MTKKIKFITRLLLLTLFSTFISCNDELYGIKDQHNDIDKNKISLTQFKNETNIDKVEPILSVSTIKSISSKAKVQLSDFVIDTLAIKKFISENNKTTYTFRIYPLFMVAKPNEIYNLVYRKVNDTYETSIFYLYKLPERDREHKLFEKIERIYDSKSTTSKTYKAASVWDCTIEVPVLHCTNTGSCATGVCDNCTWCVHTVISHANCSSGGSSTGGGSSDPGNTSGSGGGASDPYVYSPNTYDNPVFDDPEYIYRTKREQTWTNLGDEAQRFFAKPENITFFNESVQYERDNNWSPESYEFANWARNFKRENQDVAWDQFENWFIGTSEGQDGEYDAAFWENPNLTFQQQTLPTYNDYVNNMARSSDGKLMKGADNIFGLVGGKVLDVRKKDKANTENTCALKVSIALNRTNIIIPNIPGQTIEGGGEFLGKYFFLNAKSLNSWMRKTFGTNNSNHIELLGNEGGMNGEKLPKSEKLKNIKGIYSMITTEEYDNKGGASGHADLLFKDSEGLANCAFGCFFNLPVKRIDVWILN